MAGRPEPSPPFAPLGWLKKMETVTVVGYFAAACSTISFTPQAWKIIKTRDTDSISAPIDGREVSIEAEVLEVIDRHSDAAEIDRAMSINAMLRDWLTGQGYLPIDDDVDDSKTEGHAWR